MKKILLYSGGLDSWLIARIWKPDVKIYIDINGSYSEQEKERLPDDVIIEHLDLSKWERDDKIIPMRNLYFLMVSANYATGDPKEKYEICLGATGGDRVLDKSPEFANKVTDLFNYLYQPQWWTNGKTFRINLDFKDFTKFELLEQYLNMDGSLNEAWSGSFSCYHPTEDGKECWSCKPCFRKFVTFYMMGKTFSEDVEIPIYKYMSNNVIPKIKDGTYGRGEQEEKDIKTVYSLLEQKYRNKGVLK